MKNVYRDYNKFHIIMYSIGHIYFSWLHCILLKAGNFVIKLTNFIKLGNTKKDTFNICNNM